MSKLSIQNIDLYYGDFKALKNINMEIEENKITDCKSAFDCHGNLCSCDEGVTYLLR